MNMKVFESLSGHVEHQPFSKIIIIMLSYALQFLIQFLQL